MFPVPISDRLPIENVVVQGFQRQPDGSHSRAQKQHDREEMNATTFPAFWL
jgi:hypothetical protein